MATQLLGSKKVRVPDLAQMKARGERIVMLTAYDATTARVPDLIRFCKHTAS
jgi:ketopantoate hydroxymethyltransferase